jgi:hypothetical protein
VLWVFVRAPVGTNLTAELWDEDAGEPDTLLADITIEISEIQPGGRWVRVSFATPVTTGNPFFVVLYADQTVTFTMSNGESPMLQHDGTAWAAPFTNNRGPAILLREDGLPHDPQPLSARKMLSFDDTVYLFYDDQFTKWDDTNGVWIAPDDIGAGGGTVHDAVLFNDEVWIALGDATDVETMDDTDTFATKTGIKATRLLVYNGFLWRVFDGNKVQYTGDGTTWSPTTPMQVGPDDYIVNALVGLEQDVLAIGEDGIYRIVPGDWVLGVAPWGSIDSRHGLHSIHWAGSVLMPVGQDLMRYTQDGTIMSVGLNRREGLPTDRQGRITTQLNFNNWSLAGVSPTADPDESLVITTEGGTPITTEDTLVFIIPATFPQGGRSTMWAWNVEGWHSLGASLSNMSVESMHFQRNTENLWFTLSDGEYIIPCRMRLPNDLTNPAKDNRELFFQPYGWMETDWFDGRLLEILKDYESLYIAGENIDENKSIELYWMTCHQNQWNRLGSVEDVTQEIRWDDYTVRPVCHRIKFGFLLRSSSIGQTPIVNAFRAKFLAMVADRFGWQLRIMVSENPERMDGTLINDTPDAQRALLDQLERATKPFLMRDIDGLVFEVRVMNAHEELAHIEELLDGVLRMDFVRNWQLEMVTTEEYQGGLV